MSFQNPYIKSPNSSPCHILHTSGNRPSRREELRSREESSSHQRQPSLGETAPLVLGQMVGEIAMPTYEPFQFSWNWREVEQCVNDNRWPPPNLSDILTIPAIVFLGIVDGKHACRPALPCHNPIISLEIPVYGGLGSYSGGSIR